MQVHVRYFAAAREAVGRDAESVDLEGESTVGDLYADLCRRHPTLAAAAPTLRFALDEQFVPAGTALGEGAVVALIPPVGGG